MVAAEQGGKTMSLIVFVMAFLMGFAPGGVRWVTTADEKAIPFEKLPPQCRCAYAKELKELRHATTTRRFFMDIDGNGISEMFLYTGETGSGGEGWSVFELRNGTWHAVGNVFGYAGKIEHNGQHGLLINQRCGWRTTFYTLYQLENGKLALRASYREDLSDNPKEDSTKLVSYVTSTAKQPQKKN